MAAVAGFGTFIPQQSQPGNLTHLLEAEISRFPAKAAVYVKHLQTGEEGGAHADDVFNSMSVIKLAIFVRAYQLIDQKTLHLDDRIEVQKADLRGGSGILRQFDVPHSVTFRDVLTQMIITSDNTATDLALARVGGLERLNGWLADSGYKFTMVQDLYHYFRKPYEYLDPEFANLSREEVFALSGGPRQPDLVAIRTRLLERVNAARDKKVKSGQPATPSVDDQAYWLGRMTPREIGRFVENIQRSTLASKESCADMLDVMRRQTAGTRRIPHFLRMPVAHKTGDNGGEGIANDVGIVSARSGPILMSFFTLGVVKEYAEMEDQIGRTARLIVEYFDGTA